MEEWAGTVRLYKPKIATNGDDRVLVFAEGAFTENGNTIYLWDLYSINVKTNTITRIHINYTQKFQDVWYNRKLNCFFYKQGDNTYISYDGLNFSLTGSYRRSYGNLNGMEVFADGLSSDGVNISVPFTYMPNAYDPVEGKYIRIAVNYYGTGHGSEVIYYYEVYESTNLSTWTKVLTKYCPTAIYPQTLETVNTDGFACVKGF